MALILDGTDGITSSGGTNVLQDASVEMSNLNATGTPSDTTFLRGDGAWAAVDVEGEIADFAAGEPGQPRLVGNAVSLFPGTYPVLTVTASDAHSVANGLVVTQGGSGFTSSTTFIDAVRLTVSKYSGTIRFRANLENGFGTGDSSYQAQIFKNSVLVQTFSGVANGTVTAIAEVSIVVNDEILWRVRRVSGGTINLANGSNTASNGYITANLFRPAV